MARWTVRGIITDTLPVLVVLTIVELGSGLVLDTLQETLLQYPSLLVLVPITIGMAGNLGSIMASRLSTATHLGLLSFEPTDETLLANALATVGLAATLFPVVGAGAWGIQSLVGQTVLPVATVVVIATLCGGILALLAVVVTITTTYVAFRAGADPDDVVLPVVTNSCDVLGVLVLFGVVRLLV